MTRRGMSLVEALVAVVILAVALGGMLTLGQQETKGVGMTEERLMAILALEELREAFGHRPRTYYEGLGLPADPAGFSPLLATVIDDHGATVPLPPDRDGPIAQAVARRRQGLSMQRMVLYQPFTTPDGVEAGMVRFLVRYKTRQGKDREVQTVQVVF